MNGPLNAGPGPVGNLVAITYVACARQTGCVLNPKNYCIFVGCGYHRSVLDRLNPLLEPGGVLPLTECGTSLDDETVGKTGAGSDTEDKRNQEGRPSPPSTSSHRVIRPHPNFRLFLTADPSCGEVSRAMRNRCVEVCLLDAGPTVALAAADRNADGGDTPLPAPADGDGGGTTAVATTEHVADLLSLVYAGGLSDPAEATAAVAVHSALVARRLKGRANCSAGEGPAPRCLLLWAELAAAYRLRGCSFQGHGDVLRRCLSLAYPGLNPGVGSNVEDRVAEATLGAFLTASASSLAAVTSRRLLKDLVGCGWKDVVGDSASSRVAQGVKLLEIAVATEANSAMGVPGGASGLLSLVVDGLYATPRLLNVPAVPSPSDLSWKGDDAAFLHSVEEAGSSTKVGARLSAEVIVLFARSASPLDRQLRSLAVHCLSNTSSERGVISANLGETVSWMMATFFDSHAVKETTSMLSEMLLEVRAQIGERGRGHEIASVGQAVLVAMNRWSPADPRSNSDLFHSLRRACRESVFWAPLGLLLRLLDASVGRRLPLLNAERVELSEARARISSGRGGEADLGWLGLSCLICEGGRDSTAVGGMARCPETRLARSVLAPYLLPLFCAVDALLASLVCRQVAEAVFAAGGGGEHGGEVVLEAVRKVVETRDTLSLLLSSSAPSRDKPGADASVGGVGKAVVKDELLFAWDPFLVSWPWLQQAMATLRSVLSASPTLRNLVGWSSASATFGAVAARVDAAVLQHSGGAEPTRDTLWEHGPRASAPSSAAGALSLARIGRLADEFRIMPVASGSSYGSGDAVVVSLGSLMREAHPSLCVALETRRELLHALSTLHWAYSNEQTDAAGGKQPLATATDMEFTAQRRDTSSSLAERLPDALEHTLRAARARFEATHRGTRLGAAERQDDGLEHHQDDLEFGEKFDEFDTEAAEAIANATLLVVSGESGVGDAAGGDSAAGFGGAGSGGGVLQSWAAVQLSPLMEHWIAVEECQILSILADLDVSAALGSSDHIEVGALMRRIARLRSAILATPSLSPAAARPHQTLLWAYADSESWPDVHGPLLKRLLPVALDSFGRRLWENVVGTPGAFALQLAPPEMISQPKMGRSSVDEQGKGSSAVAAAADGTVFSGPVQLLTLARSSFLLRFLGTTSFRGGVVPGCGGGRGCMDLTLMNASARLGQFRMAMRGVRDLAYGGGSGGDGSGGALTHLVLLCWATLRRTLGAFDSLVKNTAAPPSEASAPLPLTFSSALPTARSGSSDTGRAVSWGLVEGPLRGALQACTDDRLAAQADDLVVPAVRNLAHTMTALMGPDTSGPTPFVEASAGLGIALLGCLRLVLVLPSSPVDPGLRPSLKKELLEERLDGVKAELTVQRWSLLLEGGGDVSPEVRLIFGLSDATGISRACFLDCLCPCPPITPVWVCSFVTTNT